MLFPLLHPFLHPLYLHLLRIRYRRRRQGRRRLVRKQSVLVLEIGIKTHGFRNVAPFSQSIREGKKLPQKKVEGEAGLTQ